MDSNNPPPSAGQAPNQGGVPLVPTQQPQPEPVVPPIYTPASSVQGKEFAPVPTVVTEGIMASEVEPTLHPEVIEAGVEKVSEVPNLTLEDQKAGIELAKESTPILQQSSFGITLPILPQQAVVIAKKGNVKESIVWLATLILRQLKIVRASKKEPNV